MKFRQFASVALLLAASSTSNASTIFSDNFNSATIGGNLTPSGWTVGGGTVDVVGGSWFGNLCAANGGSCVDLDGSTNQGGTLISTSLSLVGGTTYQASFDLAGNQRGAAADTVKINFGTAASQLTLSSSSPWTTYHLSFSPAASGLYKLTFQNLGGDNQGAVLDNVSVSAVPLPAALPLMASGLGLLGFLGRRRKVATV